MIELLLVISFLCLLVLVSLLLQRPERDWYVVEWRACSDSILCSEAFPAPASFGFDKLKLSAHGLRIEEKTRNFVRLRKDKNRALITLNQTVFEELGAAQLYFDSIKELIPFGENYQKLYVWRIVSRSRRAAHTMPPKTYGKKQGEVLVSFPATLWFDPSNSRT